MTRGRGLSARVRVGSADELETVLQGWNWNRPWHFWEGEACFATPAETVIISVIRESGRMRGMSRGQKKGVALFFRDYPRIHPLLHECAQREYADFRRQVLDEPSQWRKHAKRMALLQPGQRVADNFLDLKKRRLFTEHRYQTWLTVVATPRRGLAEMTVSYSIDTYLSGSFKARLEVDIAPRHREELPDKPRYTVT